MAGLEPYNSQDDVSRSQVFRRRVLLLLGPLVTPFIARWWWIEFGARGHTQSGTVWRGALLQISVEFRQYGDVSSGAIWGDATFLTAGYFMIYVFVQVPTLL